MTMLLRKPFSHYLDKLVRPEIYLFHRPRSVFQVCGYTGGVLVILLTIMMVIHIGLSPWIVAGLLLAATLTFFGLAMLTKIITGEERLVYYYHEIAVMVVATLLLWLLRQPALPYLDVMILDVGLFLACGRVGCLIVGCCHGRPNSWGACYREEHATAGFTPYLVGVRLFPIQVVESLWVFCTVVVGSVFVLSGHPPGTALAWYVITYGIGRFCFEFMRGDPERPYLWEFSEAQWISLFLMCIVVWTELSGVLPFYLWHAGATACLAITMIAIALRRFWKTAKHQLLHPRHVKEIVEALDHLSKPAIGGNDLGQNLISDNILLKRTSLGVKISVSKIKSESSYIYHYALSHQDGLMAEETARALAGLILQLKHASGSNELIKGNQGVFHLLVYF